ncbi:MAG: beta-ketoacyl synthase chain length factor [Arenicellales bacterium]
MTLTAYVEGIGLLGPGLTDWPTGRDVLSGQQPYQPRPTVLPSPELLPAAERRRSGAIVKLTLAIGLEAINAAGIDPTSLPTVFSSSGGDGANCHAICEMLASGDRQISPTRFHNSVHNTAAGYWSIATGAMTTASILGAFDASFGAGLLEALAQAVVDDTRTVLLACDTAYPEPLYSARPIVDAFGIALVLSPRRDTAALARIKVEMTDTDEDRLDNGQLEDLRRTIPAARGLPLLYGIAQQQDSYVVLDYLDDVRLGVAITPC